MFFEREERGLIVKVWILVIGLLTAGCGTLSLAGMTPEQLKEAVKVKDANAGCIVINSSFGRAVSVWANTDKGVNGKIGIKGDTCDTTLEGLTEKK